MKRVLVFLFAVCVVAPVLAGPTFQIQMSDPGSRYSNGGPFRVTMPDSSTFLTFCVELDDSFPWGMSYATIDPAVKYVGAAEAAIDLEVKYAYAAYLNQGTYNDVALNKYTQLAIWQEMGYSGRSELDSHSAGYWYGMLTDYYTNVEGWDFDTTGYGQIQALNLWKNADGTGDRQSQLVRVVPAPGALLLGSIGMGLVGWLRRRRVV